MGTCMPVLVEYGCISTHTKGLKHNVRFIHILKGQEVMDKQYAWKHVDVYTHDYIWYDLLTTWTMNDLESMITPLWNNMRADVSMNEVHYIAKALIHLT